MFGAPVKDCKEIEITSAMVADGVEILRQFEDSISLTPASQEDLVEAIARSVLKHVSEDVSSTHASSPSKR